MKKTVRFLGALFLAVSLLMTASCGNTLNGTYKSTGLIPGTLTFDGNHAQISAFGINASGTYEIEKDKIIFHYSILGLEQSMDFSYKKDGKYIYIGDTEFKKE